LEIYFASGFTVSNVKGREKKLYYKFKKWNRLVSFYFLEGGCNQILDLIKKEKKRKSKKGGKR